MAYLSAQWAFQEKHDFMICRFHLETRRTPRLPGTARHCFSATLDYLWTHVVGSASERDGWPASRRPFLRRKRAA